MTAYFIRRILLIIPTFLGITIMVFIVTRFVPGGPIERIIAEAQQMQSMEGGPDIRLVFSRTIPAAFHGTDQGVRCRCHSHGGALFGRAKRK